MTPPLRIHATTHAGYQHPRNEDAFAVVPLDQERSVLLVVCDGMGGMGRGDEASQVAIASLRATMEASEAGFPPDRMRDALRKADRKVREALCDGDVGMPGSTAVLVYVVEGAAHVAWVGDSRAYLVRDGKVMDRTRDHKLVEELVDAGQITHEEAKASALVHVVTRALGGKPMRDPPVNPATLGYPWKLHTGDRILLCSDGVTDLVGDDELAVPLGKDPEAATDELVRMALERGGHDNITCIVAAWDGPSWIEDEMLTPGMATIAPPDDDDPAEVTFDGVFGSDRMTGEINMDDLRSSEPAAPPRAKPPAATPTWLVVGVVLAAVVAVLALLYVLGSS